LFIYGYPIRSQAKERPLCSLSQPYCERNKNCAARKEYSESETSSEESDYTPNAGATTWVEEDKTPNLGPFTGNPGV
jgi:hypothetical protein